MNLFPKRRILSIILWVRQEFTMSKKLKWQGTSKKTRSQIYPIFNNSRNKDSQTYIQIITKILDTLNQDRLKTRKLDKPKELIKIRTRFFSFKSVTIRQVLLLHGRRNKYHKLGTSMVIQKREQYAGSWHPLFL